MKIFIFFLILTKFGFFSVDIDDLIANENINTIITNYDKDLSEGEISKTFNNELLVFVTPWNRDGMKYTKKFAKKIDYVSPVWVDLKSILIGTNSMKITLDGEHNIDETYIQELKAENPDLKVLPRVYLSTEDEHLIQGLEGQISIFIDLFEKFIRKYESLIDGIVFDSPWFSYLSVLEVDFLDFLQKVSDLMHEHDKLFITSLMGLNNNMVRRKSDMTKLLKISDKVLVCTYDYQGGKQGTKPISPYKWVKTNMEYFSRELDIDYEIVSKKIMMGIPFYGFKIENNSKMGHLLGGEYMEILKGTKPKYTWNIETRECEISTSTNNVNLQLYYPCLRFLKERLNLFEEGNVGAFVWDGGQGLPYFYELF